jgi:hypothetical protein
MRCAAAASFSYAATVTPENIPADAFRLGILHLLVSHQRPELLLMMMFMTLQQQLLLLLLLLLSSQ